MKLPIDVATAVTMAANRNGLDPYVLAALVQQESSGMTDAIRYEPDFPYLWDVEKKAPFRGALNPKTFPSIRPCSGATEWMAQKTSWGCAQVMGAVARELGYTGTFLSELIEPTIGVEYGARLLSRFLHKYDLEDALSSYNAGHPITGNRDTYVAPIVQRIDEFRRGGGF